MTKKEIEAIREKHQAAADKAYCNYQETGIARYDNQYNREEDLVMICNIAANAADDRQKLSEYQAEIMYYGSKAMQLNHEWNDEKAKEMIKDLSGFAKSQGVRDPWR